MSNQDIRVIPAIREMREFVRLAQAGGRKVGLVPTMGALHEGHLSLVKAAAESNDCVVASIFVNSIQFCPGEDLKSYPRDLESDVAMLDELGVEAVFAPADEEMYPDGDIFHYVEPQKIDRNLCGLLRPGHFRGVTTVVTKLFNIVPADEAFFGRKDAQQAAIIRRLVKDLDIPIRISVCPIVREHDGLALSSRNRYLSDEERAQAISLYRSLEKARENISRGERNAGRVIAEMRLVFEEFERVALEYASVVDSETIEDIEVIEGSALIAVAARVGKARLIDNMVADVRKDTFEL